jgi:hypothetical protein
VATRDLGDTVEVRVRDERRSDDQMSRRSNGGNPHFTKSEQGFMGCAALEFFPGAIREKPRKTADYSRARARAHL